MNRDEHISPAQWQALTQPIAEEEPMDTISREAMLAGASADDFRQHLTEAIDAWVVARSPLAFDWRSMMVGVLLWLVAEELRSDDTHDDAAVMAEIGRLITSAWAEQRQS